MSKTDKIVQLPLTKTIYQTYTFQGGISSILAENPSIRNWYLNEIFILRCNKTFVNGTYSSPVISIERSGQYDCPYFECEILSATYLEGNILSVIRSMIDLGYYVFIFNMDDYYVPGKSWYHEWHVCHDALIFGYDQDKRTFDMLSYDKNWIYQPYKTSQRGVEKGFLACADCRRFGQLSAIKPKAVNIGLNPKKILKTMQRYLNPTLNDSPNAGNLVFGILVHDYLALYLDLLYDEFYPHERMDRRVFRMIWEHKVVMLERLKAVENMFNWNDEISKSYASIVNTADALRMMYASHFVKPRKSILPIIKKKLLNMKKEEEIILQKFTERLEKALQDQKGGALFWNPF